MVNKNITWDPQNTVVIIKDNQSIKLIRLR